MARILIGTVCLFLNACGAPAPPGAAATQAPLQPPEQGQRAFHPAGYSVVFPPGLQPDPNPLASQFDTHTKDALGTVAKRKPDGSEEFGAPSLTVRRFSDAAVAAGCVPAFYKPTQFHGQPAFAHFDPGYGPGSDRARKNTTWATKGGTYPYLQQELIFENNGAWFQLTFSMSNVQGSDPVYTEPLNVVQKYFDTFEYNLAPAPAK
jgi:hypothetical protein